MAELEAALLDQDCFDDCVQDAKRKCDNRGNCKPCCAALKPLSPREEKEAAARLAGHSIANDPQSRQQARPIFFFFLFLCFCFYFFFFLPPCDVARSLG